MAESMLYNIVRGNLCNLTMDLTLMLSKANEEEKTSCYAIRKKLEMLETVLNNRKPDLLNYQEPSLSQTNDQFNSNMSNIVLKVPNLQY